jgi:cation diffusion facilitator CzcD-associated flavoprotein CzcO
MNTAVERHQAIIVGAGVCGIYMMHQLLDLGIEGIVLERGTDLGGTWYWNRYPGARFDSESYSYGYSFDPDILEEWDWSEHFSPQPETLRYLNYVADKWDVRQYMRFNSSVVSAQFNDDSDTWMIELEDGRRYECAYFLSAIGMLSAPTMPTIEGVERFQGQSFHTYYWPKEKVDLAGKRVAVVGTGATGVQVIGAIAEQVGQLTVYQRRPNWCAPLHNAPIDKKEMARIRATYPEIFAKMMETPGSFLHGPDRRDFNAVSEEERLAFWEELYASPGFGVWLGNFRDVLMDPAANAQYSEFIADKIRARVDDPVVAEKLIPKDHGFGTRRVPMETRYYEAYNLEHVTLVDINDTPIECVTEKGIQTSDQEREFDVIIYATGFDAITGSFDRIDIRGSQGQKLREKWANGPLTYLGLQVAGFPNLITLAGPQGASVSSNLPPGIEFAVQWTTGLLAFMQRHGYRRVQADPDCEQEWVEEVKSGYEGSLLGGTRSWFTGYNSNIEGRDNTRYLIYLLGAPKYREKMHAIADDGYTGFHFS